MGKLLITKSVFLNFVIVISALHAGECQNAAENVIRWAHTSIAQIEEGKIFLKPEKLHLEQGIIYVEDIDGAEFAVPVVFPSEGRPYVEVDQSTIFNLWKCKCGTWNHKWDNPTHCWRCKEPR